MAADPGPECSDTAPKRTADHPPDLTTQASETLSRADAACKPPSAALPPLRYQPREFHAAGNLGEVLIAQDNELNRSVALKRIQAKHADNAESRRRFLREAEVTGRLEHPGVVPVYGLGQDGDGRPCYAMRLIQGESLKEATERFHAAEKAGRDPGERRLALRLLLTSFVAVCKTMAYAHSRGVLHRDLKPANIMLGKYGETLVVDWGLAKTFERDDKARLQGEASLQPGLDGGGSETQTGTMLGTPGYSGPEQAAGQWTVVGPASDIFSLGATLYNLLTNALPYSGESAAEIVALAILGEIIPPRQRKSDCPRALEAICLKAMTTKREERYATALDLAVDVEHWLADEPVSVYREPWPQRLWRWTRRHRGLAASSVAGVAVAAMSLAVVSLVMGRKNAELAATSAELAGANTREHAAAELARQTIEDMTSEDALRFLETQKELRPEQRHFLEQAVAYYRQALGQEASGEEGQARQARAYFRMGKLQQRLGLNAEAEATYRAALEEYKRLAGEHPPVPAYRQELARSHSSLGLLLNALGRRPEAEKEHRAALVERERLATELPQVPDYRQDLAMSHNNLGALLAILGKRPEAEKEYRAALVEQERLAAEHPQVPDFRQDLAMSRYNLGLLLGQLGKRQEADQEYRAALVERERLAAEHPQVPDFRRDLARSHNGFGNLLSHGGKRTEAEKEYRAALAEYQRLASEHPQVPAYAVELAGSCCNFGNLLSEHGQPAEALDWYAQAIETLERALSKLGADVTGRRFLCYSHLGRAEALTKLGRYTKAIGDWDRALSLDDGSAGDAIRAGRAKALVQAGEVPRASADAEELLKAESLNSDALYDIACVFSLASAKSTDSVQAERYAGRAVSVLREAVAKGYANIEHMKQDTDLNPLRQREDFQKLLRELEAKKSLPGK
jgi:serine/threonine-protein kinase